MERGHGRIAHSYGEQVNVAMIGCSVPYREAVEQQLIEQAVAYDFSEAGPEVVLINCDSPARWLELEVQIERGAVCIALLPELLLDDYTKALALGAAGVVQLDMPSVVTADVIRSAAHGEVVLARHVANSIARKAIRREPKTELDEPEIELLRAIGCGETVVNLAAQRFYSERTLRRHLQGIYLKLGARNRAEAIAAATRAGLLD